MITKFLHYGFSVDDLERAIELYSSLGFKVSNRIDKPEPKAKIAQMEREPGETGLELWQFIDDQHPQVEYIKTHIALESDNLEADLEDLEKLGFEIVIPITKGVSLTYAFVKDLSGNFIEVAKKQ